MMSMASLYLSQCSEHATSLIGTPKLSAYALNDQSGYVHMSTIIHAFKARRLSWSTATTAGAMNLSILDFFFRGTGLAQP